MGIVVEFQAHAAPSAGYKSGRSSERGTPETRSTASTRRGGTSSHCETACLVKPSLPASSAKPPEAAIARLSASLRSTMGKKSIITLLPSQASLHCACKDLLYAIDMTVGSRIKTARRRLVPKMTQRGLAGKFGITDKAVSAWERGESMPEYERLPALREILRVTFAWLLAGSGPPPAPDDATVKFDDWLAASYGKNSDARPPATPTRALKRGTRAAR